MCEIISMQDVEFIRRHKWAFRLWQILFAPVIIAFGIPLGCIAVAAAITDEEESTFFERATRCFKDAAMIIAAIMLNIWSN